MDWEEAEKVEKESETVQSDKNIEEQGECSKNQKNKYTLSNKGKSTILSCGYIGCKAKPMLLQNLKKHSLLKTVGSILKTAKNAQKTPSPYLENHK